MDETDTGPGTTGDIPWRGTVSTVDGPFATARERRARPPASDIRVDGPDGTSLAFGDRPPPGVPPIAVRVVRAIGYHAFDTCPICLAPAPATREHVPPAALGGTVATLLCQRCNNDLGSRLEIDLLDWRDNAFRRPRLSGGPVPGRRRVERLLRRTTDDGRFVLVPDGKADPELRRIVASGRFEIEFAAPNPARYRLAALKHAYLAACLDTREIPTTPTAALIRRDLLAARDAPPNAPVPLSGQSAPMPLMRSYEPAPGAPPLALCAAGPGDEPWILLGGGVCVPWPLPDHPPAP